MKINNLVFKIAKFLNSHRWLYYILNLTWGIFLTFIGFLISIILLIGKKKPIKYQGIYYFGVGKSWGGFETGLMFIRDTTSSEHLSMHELGHTYQNAIFGPFQIFVITIPSMIRYWYRHIKYEKKGIIPDTKYDDIWFESNASRIGHYIVEGIDVLSNDN